MSSKPIYKGQATSTQSNSLPSDSSSDTDFFVSFNEMMSNNENMDASQTDNDVSGEVDPQPHGDINDSTPESFVTETVDQPNDLDGTTDGTTAKEQDLKDVCDKDTSLADASTSQEEQSSITGDTHDNNKNKEGNIYDALTQDQSQQLSDSQSPDMASYPMTQIHHDEVLDDLPNKDESSMENEENN